MVWKRVVKPLVIVFAFCSFLTFLGTSSSSPYKIQLPLSSNSHPIDTLIAQADQDFNNLLALQVKTPAAAAAAYRSRRGRHPPPGFHRWFELAQKYDAVIVEDFFDQIYSDLEPFWAVPAADLAGQASNMAGPDCVVHVRNGTAIGRDGCWNKNWMKNYLGAIKEIEQYLPDLSVPFNMMDGPRLDVPWEDIESNLEAAKATRQMNLTKVKSVKAKFSPYKTPEGQFKPKYHGDSHIELFLATCLPHTAARNPPDYAIPAPELMPANGTETLFHGFVANWTHATDPCENLNLLGLQSAFVKPCSVSKSTKLFPLFSGSKLPTNNDVLFPAAKYWDKDKMFHLKANELPKWNDKESKVVWRGTASGGDYNEENWMRFQRHRFVTMMNASVVQQAVEEKAPSFRLAEEELYNIGAEKEGKMSEWISMHSDVGFSDMTACNTPNEAQERMKSVFQVRKGQSMTEQFKNKYVPDIDGNSFSGRYRAFLQSNSVPIKATIYREWHDARLMPWLHFVPMDNSFIDLYGILDYFIGSPSKAGHDSMGRVIAEQGQQWAKKAMRREDMLLYIHRLLLEFARVCDENRENLGYVSDLLVMNDHNS